MPSSYGEVSLASYENGPQREQSSGDKGGDVDVNARDEGGKLVDSSHPNSTSIPGLRALPRWTKWITAFITLISGVLSTYAFKVMNRVEVPPCEGCTPRYFEGGFIQVFCMFCGESLCVPIWALDVYYSKRANKFPVFSFVTDPAEAMKPKPKNMLWTWFAPALMDLCATLMLAIAMQITYASTVQMLRNFLVAISCLCQVLIVRKAPTVHQYVGVVIVTGAMVLSAIPAIIYPETATNTQDKAAVGIILALIGTSVQGAQLTFEDFLMRKTKIPPSQGMGFAGLFGLAFTLIAMPIGNAAGIEKVWESWYQAGRSGTIIGWIVGYVFIATAFNIFGLSTTFLATGLLRSVIFALRAPVVWIVDLILKWVEYDHYSLASILIFCFGFACYCRMFELPGTVGRYWRKPLHCGKLTKKELDDDYVPLAKAESEAARGADDAV